LLRATEVPVNGEGHRDVFVPEDGLNEFRVLGLVFGISSIARPWCRACVQACGGTS
jgi:hypothetical protein